ncbi:hypothesis_protein [African swine fever virus]|nr:hypothesis_protein [African swine fever virus]UNZ12293.1 hypothetical protein [African swine fever virus]UNZ12512.1 hypothetical protein [African swine fever virus]
MSSASHTSTAVAKWTCFASFVRFLRRLPIILPVRLVFNTYNNIILRFNIPKLKLFLYSNY